MATVQCKNCGQDMVIDEPGGIAYITYADGSISHAVPTDQDVPPVTPTQGA